MIEHPKVIGHPKPTSRWGCLAGVLKAPVSEILAPFFVFEV